jgi:hypothetical protein
VIYGANGIFVRKVIKGGSVCLPPTFGVAESSFSVVKKGTKIQLGEGEGPEITLENDAASQYVCQTDAVKTLVLKDGKWVNIYDE